MTRLIVLAGLRFYTRHPWQLVLALAGIALGVAVYVGVALANDSARRAFDDSARALTGRATHQLLPLGGDLPEAVFAELILERGISQVAPVVEGRVRFARLPERRFDLLGIDPLQEQAFRPTPGAGSGAASAIGALMSETDTVLLPAALARMLDAAPGTTLELLGPRGPHSVRVLGVMGSRDAAQTEGQPIIADIASAQEILGKTGRLTRIDLILEKREAAALAAQLPAGTVLVPAQGRDQAFAELSRAFRVNLTALSLLALFVGVFLIYSTISFAIVQRRATLGTLRAIGVSRVGLAAHLLVEAAALGGVATVCGLLLGHELALRLVALVLRTISDLSFRSALAGAPPASAIYWQGAALGIAATLGAALGPALDAARTAPRAVISRAALERQAARRARVAAGFAAPALAMAWLLLVLRADLLSAFVAMFFVLAAGALVTPLATVWLTRLAVPVARSAFGLPGSMAVRGVEASLSRTGVAVAALTVAVATVIGIGIMTASFRESFAAWLDTTLRSDIYLAVTGEEDALDAALLEQIRALPGVADVSRTRALRLPSAYGDLGIRALSAGPRGWGLDILSGDPERALDRFAAGEGVLMAEALGFRAGLEVGDQLELPGPEGVVHLPVLGIVRDYGMDSGGVLMTLELYQRLWGDRRITGAGIALAANADAPMLRRRLEELIVSRPELRVRDSATIRRLSLAIFDRTFKITEVLRVLAGLVAFLGMVSALLAIQLERAREVAVLRALGFDRAQLRVLAMAQTGLLGLIAGVLAVPLGVILAALLVFVINRRSFGWSMDLAPDPAPLLIGIAVALAAALLAGIYPALRIGQSSLARELERD